jgi:phosphoenolpyruvate synthase/pyruvate phosphate dikinase
MKGMPVTLRTLDIGGDKPVAYLPLPTEENPALGVRGIRTGLLRPELLDQQLRAILNVRGAVRPRIMLPMISSIAELRAVRSRLDELEPGGAIALGIMSETPAPALLPGDLAALPGVTLTTDPREAVRGAHAVMALRLQQERMTAGYLSSMQEYADTYQVNERLMGEA